MQTPVLACIYLMFFFSGAAALVYQVVWVRSLTLVFGGSHLAVTAVLSTFMTGLALGGWLIGRRVDGAKHPLRLYGLLELGIAASAALSAGLMDRYPSLYPLLAEGRDDSLLYLSGVRVLFSVAALIIPTTLMGGTLPVLARLVSQGTGGLKRPLSFLYGLNTLGAVFGAAAGGFVLLRLFSVSATLRIAIAANLAIGFLSIHLQRRVPEVPAGKRQAPGVPGEDALPVRTGRPGPASRRLVLWGIGASGFCALGYEVLWSRVLATVTGASVYAFTVMLIAFLTGIALGSKAYGLLPKRFGAEEGDARGHVVRFGVVQLMIGASALAVTVCLRDLPLVSVRLLSVFPAGSLGLFGAKMGSNLLLAFLYMLVPAFFMGLAFPLAGTIHAAQRQGVGSAVGEVLAANTIGAILGAALCGFALIYWAGIERSLQLLTVVNIGFGLLAIASPRRSRPLNGVIGSAAAVVMLLLALNDQAFRVWDAKAFAVYRNNQPEAFRTAEMVRDAVENTEVLYYGEGAEALVSSIRVTGGDQAFITNGRIEASSHVQGRQHLYALGHLPMLLHRNPRTVLVVGTGSGMTLGAASVHPGVEELTLAEIEPKVIGVARTFEAYNHRVLDDPRLRIVFNDGRNHLLTTKKKFDVITADPIHPWFRGAGYLYTAEYFKLAAEHLAPGGVICQWLPLYELSTEDVRSIVRTFTEQFPFTMLWLTHYDAELVGSKSPIVLDERDLERRLAAPAVAADLKGVMMGSAPDLLSYFVMGREGMRAFGKDGVLNTDDNLSLEFSAPFSAGNAAVMQENILAVLSHRENVLDYLRPEEGRGGRSAQLRRWNAAQRPADLAGLALALYLGGEAGSRDFRTAMEELERRYPGFAPGRFLREVYVAGPSREPTLIGSTRLPLLGEHGARTVLVLSAVLVPVTTERAAVLFVDNDARFVYGELDVPGGEAEELMQRLADEVMTDILRAYHRIAAAAPGQVIPQAGPVKKMIREVVSERARQRRES